MDYSKDYQKTKKRKESFKKIVIHFFIWALVILVAVSFILMGSFSGDDVQHRDTTKIAEINGKIYDYSQNSEFGYIFSSMKERLNRQNIEYEYNLDARTIDGIALSQSLENLINNALMLDFAKERGITPAKETIKKTIETMIIGTPSDGLLNYIYMEYANKALVDTHGDIMNAVFPVTVAELYSYFDLVNFTAQAEALYIDITNYVVSRINVQEVTEYYNSNIKLFAKELYIEDISVLKKGLSHEVAKFAVENGWDNTLSEYEGNYEYDKYVVLTPDRGTTKRFNLALEISIDEIYTNSQYENGSYHIFRLIGYPNYNSLDNDYKEIIKQDYVKDNYETLKVKYFNDIKALIEKAYSMVNTTSFYSISRATGVSYIKTGRISPVNKLLRDVDGNVIYLPILNNHDWMRFLFTKPLNTSSEIFQTGDHFVILKAIDRGDNPNINYDEIDEELFFRYMRFKNEAISMDWMATLKTNSQYRIFDEEIENLF